jgi:nucleotide-binding universal stress UspA family protein
MIYIIMIKVRQARDSHHPIYIGNRCTCIVVKKILVPCDFSTPAVHAFKLALDIASANQGEVFVLKVIDVPCLYRSHPCLYECATIVKLKEEYERQFETLKNLYAGTVPVSFSIERDSIRTSVLKTIDAKGIDLVVMGTYGVGAIHDSIGTNTARTIRSSSVPVIALKAATNILSIRTIVFALPFEINQAELVSMVKSLQNFFRATLHILFVNTPLNFQTDAKTWAVLEEFVRHFNIQNYTLAVRNDNQAQEGIIHYAAEINADMIMLGTHGRKGVSYLLYGSVTEDVVHLANCPVWTCTLQR